MKAHSLFLASFAGLLALATPAGAVVQVVGTSLAHDCFLMALAGLNTPLEGLATCNSALENEGLTPHDRAATFVNRGVIEITLQRYEDALADYNRGIVIMPDLGDAYIDRGGAYIFLKRYDEAMDDIAHGMTLDLSYPYTAYYNRAVAEELTGHYTESYHDYQHVLELAPDFAMAKERLRDFKITTKPAGESKPDS